MILVPLSDIIGYFSVFVRRTWWVYLKIRLPAIPVRPIHTKSLERHAFVRRAIGNSRFFLESPHVLSVILNYVILLPLGNGRIDTAERESHCIFMISH